MIRHVSNEELSKSKVENVAVDLFVIGGQIIAATPLADATNAAASSSSAAAADNITATVGDDGILVLDEDIEIISPEDVIQVTTTSKRTQDELLSREDVKMVEPLTKKARH